MQKPPIRYDAYQRDYSHDIGSHLVVSLDGQAIKNVIRYDCESGEIETYVQDNKGQFEIENDDAKRIIQKGLVTVDWGQFGD